MSQCRGAGCFARGKHSPLGGTSPVARAAPQRSLETALKILSFKYLGYLSGGDGGGEGPRQVRAAALGEGRGDAGGGDAGGLCCELEPSSPLPGRSYFYVFVIKKSSGFKAEAGNSDTAAVPTGPSTALKLNQSSRRSQSHQRRRRWPHTGAAGEPGGVKPSSRRLHGTREPVHTRG